VIGRPGQGEALAAWALWGATTVVLLVTYARVPPEETYNVSRDGLAGGLSRTVTHLGYPVALAAIALVLVAMASLPRAAWWVAGPAIALCSTVPFVVDQADLDARAVNLVPATGVTAALALTVAAARRAGTAFQPTLPGDRVRVVLAVAAVALALPWIAALAGFHLPGDLLMGEEPFRTSEGSVEAAVHLGAHHGLYGALLLLTALATSRVVPAARGVRVALLACTAALAGYGSVNLVQDLWLEQVVKRGWAAWRISSAVMPGLNPITAVWLAVGSAALLLLLRERAILRR
jgi:hypothetical protein